MKPILFFVLIINTNVYAQTAYVKGINAFNKKDYKNAIAFLLEAEKAPETEYKDSVYYYLGSIYQCTVCNNNDDKKDFDYFNKGADKGNMQCQYRLANFYFVGNTVEKDTTKALNLLAEAVRNSNGPSALFLAKYFASMHDEFGEEKASEYYEQAAQLNETEAMIYLGVEAIKKETEADYARALKYFSKAAELKNYDANYYLAKMYSSGWGVVQSDIEAAKQYSIAANQKYRIACYELGMMYQTGKGIKESKLLAKKYIAIAAQKNYMPAVKYMYANKYWKRG